MLRDIKAKYFDNGLKDHLANDYLTTTELIVALSILQNCSRYPQICERRSPPSSFSSQEPSSPCIAKLRIGFKNLGFYQIANAIPNFLHVFRPSQSYALSRRMLMTLLSPIFLKRIAMHAASKQKFMSCFLNTPDLQQVDKGVQSPSGIYFNLFLAVTKSPRLGFRVPHAIEFSC